MLSLIVAMDLNNLIGKDNDLPWYYPEDLKYFKQTTTGKAVLMGKNTYMSIFNRIGSALPNRINYVLTHQKKLPGDAIIVTDVERLLTDYQKEELFIIGGKTIYEMFLKKVDRLYITRINKSYEGDCYFPDWDQTDFNLISSTSAGDLTFLIYERKQK